MDSASPAWKKYFVRFLHDNSQIHIPLINYALAQSVLCLLNFISQRHSNKNNPSLDTSNFALEQPFPHKCPQSAFWNRLCGHLTDLCLGKEWFYFLIVLHGRLKCNYQLRKYRISISLGVLDAFMDYLQHATFLDSTCIHTNQPTPL